MLIRIFATTLLVCSCIFPASAQDAENAASKHLQAGIVLFDQGKFEGAVLEYKKALDLKPDYGSAHYELGQTYWKLKKHDLAEQELNASLRLNPKCSICYMALGNLFDDQGQRQRAIESYKSAMTIDPASARPHYNLAITYVRMDRTQEAIAELLEAERLDPNYASPYFLLGQIYFRTGRLFAASDQLQKATELEKDGARAENAKKLNGVNVTIDQELKEREMGDHMTYCLVRAGSISPESYRKRHPDAQTYMATLEDEVEVYRSWATIMDETGEHKGRPAAFSGLVKVLKAGYLPQFLLASLPEQFETERAGYDQRNPGKMDEFRRWASENHVELRPLQPQCEVRWMDRTW